MIVYFADRQLNILGQASTELPDGLTVYDDNKTEDVETGIAVFECRIPFNSTTRAMVEECTHVGNYILRSHEDENEFYTIIDAEIDTKKQEAYVYAEDAGLDLLNEVVGAYTADNAYPIDHYVNKFAFDSGFQIGVNEAVNITRKLSWDGEATVTERLASVATQFGGFEISFSFDIKGLEIKNKYINIYQERGQDNGVQLRLNKDIDRIIAKKSIANLATALECIGGTPENEEDPITLEGYTYDDGDFFVSGTRLYSREAVKKWSRYNWAKEPNQVSGNKGHIVKIFTYDTTVKGTLCAHAITKLKKLREIEINYEIEVTNLPEGTKIGDWVSVVDDDGELYVSGRILLLETSVTNKKKAVTLGEYLIRNSGISDKVTELAEQFSKSSKTAEKALGIANAAKTNAENAQTVADQAAAEVETLQTVAEEATAAVKVAQESAATAQAAADKAQEAVDGVGDRIDALEVSVLKAQEAADGAQLAADTAQERANQAAQSAAQAILDAAAAKDAADSVEATASAAKTEAEAAKSAAEAAKTQAETAQATAEAAKLDAEQAQKDIAELEEQLETVSNTMTADFARKTALTEATTSLQSQISQNAANITSTVSRLDTVDETANDAKEQAQTAQSTANTAKSKADQATADAAAAQSAADEAAAAAAAAQGEADTAKSAAASAQSVADKAKTDLEAAKKDLATVSSRVDATEEDIEAAQSAVTAAQTAANKAQADASEAATKAVEAQSRADTAVTNASNAQTAANDAASKANLAQKAADEAKGDASAAQTAADEAASVAAEAQRTANTAVTNAAAAQKKADDAAQAAADAQTAADNADAKAAQAASDLATAKQNLADVTSRVDATEEEVEAAQAAVATAQAAADKAKEDAAAAQSTANTAKTNAANAQTAANNAKTAADNAQAAADEAQKAADDAQDAVDALAVRVTSAETSITQNAEAIALRATKTEVTQTLGGYYTKTEADAAIQVKANEITSSVSNTYATKTALASTDTKAANAQEAAEAAQSTADTAKTNAATAQSTANTAKSNAATAQTAANNAKTAADNAKTAADNAQAAAEEAQQAADDAQADVDDLATRVTSAETAITQNSEAIALRATKTEVTETLGGYYTKEEADAAIQVKANAITSSVSNTYATKSALSATDTKAANAKTAADNAADAAEAAQSTADTAKANAATAKSAADTAQSTANTAKTNAANAQSAAEAAAQDAADAQSTADTALANAATAQSTANTAKTNAGNAQTAANNAQKAADAAQDDVDALASRVTTAETTISQHTDQIALRATKTEVTQTLGGYYTKSETDSAIQVSANAVTSSVASTYATKTALNTTAATAENALKQSAEFIKGTQTAATGSWTGVSETITALYDGLQIIYWLPYAGSGNATLNLTLADGTTTGAKNVYHKGTTRVTTQYSAGSPIKLTYLVNATISGGTTKYTGWWVDASYEGSNTYDRTRYSSAVKSLDDLTKSVYYIMVGTSAGYKKAASGVSFDVSYPVLAWYYTTAVAANATTTYMYTAMPSVTLRNNVASWTGTQYAMAYLVGTLEGKTFTINSTVFTSTVPTAADGLAYIPIGILYSTYQVYFRTDSTVYAYGEDGFAPLAEIAQVDAGMAAETATDAQSTADAATERVSIAESTIQQLADSIAMLITDENGASLMTQTENGWTYNMAQISNTLDGATNDIDALTESLGGVDNTVQALQQAVNDLGILTDYVIVTTYNGQPCIELGESENNFRLRITNTEIQFVDGTTIPAYVSNKKLMIEQAEVKDELQFGNFVWKIRSNGNMGLMWKGATNCSITYVLTNAASTNTATAAMQGSSYSTQITMDAGRVVQTVSVTMGGENITSTAYSNGTISIAEVTGDVVITVAASNYINRLALAVDTDGSIYNGVGYMSGYRLSSGGALSGKSGSYVTGFVACKVGDVIRMKNITFQYGITSGVTSTNQRISFFDSSKAHILQTNATGLGGVANGVKDANGVWTQFTIKASMSSTDCSGTAYFRLNATYIGADSIITVNEEIT